jgi:aminocarboxymuconate-semialdehyde decarboxylase
MSSSTPVIDMHAHFFPRGLSVPDAAAGDPRWPRLVVDSAESGRIMRGDTLFRPVRASLWSVADRIAELDEAGVDIQVVSPVPVTMTSWAEPSLAQDYARRQNDLLAEAVAESRGRLLGLGTVALQDPDSAVRELHRMVGELGLSGVEIGSRINEFDLDDDALGSFFAAAVELDVAVFVHPVEGGGGTIRRGGQPYDFGIGMTTETSLAAAALVFGGVLDRYPDLRVLLSHGGGSFVSVYPRARYGAEVIAGMDTRQCDNRVRSLYVDSIVHDAALLRAVMSRFGVDKVVLGSDDPFFPSGLVQSIAAVRAADLTDRERAAILGANALALLKPGNLEHITHQLQENS